MYDNYESEFSSGVTDVSDLASPLRLSLNTTPLFLRAELLGEIRPASLLATWDSFLKNNLSILGLNCLADFTQANLDAVKTRNLTELAQLVEYWLKRQKAGPIYVAAVAPTPRLRSKADFYRKAVDNALQHVVVFDTEEEARAWLVERSEEIPA